MAKIPLIIFGTENFADIAFEYFTHDSNYEVVAFTVDKAYQKKNVKFKRYLVFQLLEGLYEKLLLMLEMIKLREKNLRKNSMMNISIK
jgi:hypothetical protein